MLVLNKNSPLQKKTPPESHRNLLTFIPLDELITDLASYINPPSHGARVNCSRYLWPRFGGEEKEKEIRKGKDS